MTIAICRFQYVIVNISTTIGQPFQDHMFHRFHDFYEFHKIGFAKITEIPFCDMDAYLTELLKYLKKT